MAKSSFIESGEITEVYYNLGKFGTDQRPRFLRAPFQFVRLNGTEYIMPVPVGGSSAELNGLFNQDTTDLEQMMGRNDFGLVNGQRIYINENQMGDGSDNVFGLHRFGFF